MKNMLQPITRAQIEALQREMIKYPQIEIATSHYFSKGMYCREMRLPAGALAVGKAHKAEHFFMIVDGVIKITTDEGIQEITGPRIFSSNPGVKRAALAITDVTMITVHKTDITDLVEIEKEIIEEDSTARLDSRNQIKKNLLENEV